MKRTLSSTLALTNLLLLAALLVITWVLLTRVDILAIWRVGRLARLVEIAAVLLLFLLLFVVPLVTLTLAIMDAWHGHRRQALLSAAISLVLVFVLLLWLGVGDSLASHQEARADRAWAQALGSVGQFLARYPDAHDSESVIKLTAAAARIGVDLDPYEVKGAQPADADQKAFAAVRKRVSAFVSSQIRKTDDGLDSPGPEVSAWLSAHDAGITALVREVRTGAPIVFATDWSSPREPGTSIFGLRNVASVIVLRALEHERGGDSQAASEALEASWTLAGALRERGELINQILVVGLDGETLGALRKLRDPPHPWRARISEHDYRQSMLRAFEGEAWRMSAIVNGWPGTDQMRRRQGDGLVRRMERPYLRLMASDSSLALARMVADLERADPCRTDWATLEKRVDGSTSRWNLLGKIGMPSVVRAWVSAARTSLETELTRNVLAARELRDERGDWPSDLTVLESSVCPGARWHYSTSPHGRMTLSIPSNPTLGPLVFQAGLR